MRNRHVREGHGKLSVRNASKQKRKQEDMRRTRLARRVAATPCLQMDRSARVFVLCPHSPCFQFGCVCGRSRGILLSSVACHCGSKDAGIRFAFSHTPRRMRRFMNQRDRPPQPRDIVTLAVLTYFILVAARVFERFPTVQYVWFAEDDCRFRTCVTLAKRLDAAEHTGVARLRSPPWRRSRMI